MSAQYGELRPTSGWDRLTSLGHPCKFQLVSCLGSVTARHLVVGVSQTLRRWTEGATYIRQGDHHVGHWPTFLVNILNFFEVFACYFWQLAVSAIQFYWEEIVWLTILDVQWHFVAHLLWSLTLGVALTRLCQFACTCQIITWIMLDLWICELWVTCRFTNLFTNHHLCGSLLGLCAGTEFHFLYYSPNSSVTVIPRESLLLSDLQSIMGIWTA